MKLRFGVDENAYERIRAALGAACRAPPVGRRLASVYLDTPDGALAAHGVALRFRRSHAIGATSADRAWRRQEIWSKTREKAGLSLKRLGIKRLKQRLDAAFDIRIERWTWIAEDGWARIALDRGEVSTGSRREAFTELRIVCKKKHVDAAMHYAVKLGAMHVASTRARDRGRALLALDLPG